MIFDTHAHYNDQAFSEDLPEILGAFQEKGIGKVVNVCYDPDSIDRTLELNRQHPEYFYCALGIHPSDCGPMTEEILEHIRKRLHEPGVVAVGEIGLDYHWDEPARVIQHHWLRRQIQMAREEKLPVIIHSRDAAEDTFRILKEEGAEKTGGVIHCYSYSAELALEYVKLGYFIGIGGVVTYKNGRKLKEVAAAVPLESIVLETDCPYLSPTPLRGTRNSSLNLPYVVQEIAAIRGITPREVEDATWENAMRLYRIADPQGLAEQKIDGGR
ncbi:MAG: TatD family hydrolase [Lachnospiraceae bacterium]|nr:TatD family hydrolase [Lachnospiraceae bacterium]